jgi:hypothetical protein
MVFAKAREIRLEHKTLKFVKIEPFIFINYKGRSQVLYISKIF